MSQCSVIAHPAPEASHGPSDGICTGVENSSGRMGVIVEWRMPCLVFGAIARCFHMRCLASINANYPDPVPHSFRVQGPRIDSSTSLLSLLRRH